MFVQYLRSPELMLLGFISLLLTVFQALITKICVHPNAMIHLLPCQLDSHSAGEESNSAPDVSAHHRRLFAEGASAAGYCAAKVSDFKPSTLMFTR